jgi:hypothetical protein
MVTFTFPLPLFLGRNPQSSLDRMLGKPQSHCKQRHEKDKSLNTTTPTGNQTKICQACYFTDLSYHGSQNKKHELTVISAS